MNTMTITYSEPTTNYASGRALLHEYDADQDGAIAMPEMMVALGDRKYGRITQEEVDYVATCWELGVGGIDKMCPPGRPGIEPATKRLTYEKSLERINAGLPVYIKFDIPVLDQIPGMQWGPGIPILPGFMLTSEP